MNVSNSWSMSIGYYLFLRYKIISSTVTTTIIATSSNGMKTATTSAPVRSEGEVVSISEEQLAPLQSSFDTEREGRGK